jgi:hypothetical protein
MRCRLHDLLGIASGMFFMHEHHAVHWDLKTGNVLLDDVLEPRVLVSQTSLTWMRV